MRINIFNLNGFLFLLLTLFFFCSCKEDNRYKRIPEGKASLNEIQWEETKQHYLFSLQKAIDFLAELESYDSNDPRSKEIFRKIRNAWKKAEPFASYLNPEVGHRINGPALPVFLEDNQRVLPAVGLQKIEESIFLGKTSEEAFINEVNVTRGMMSILYNQMQNKTLTPDRFFISVHQQLLRIISFSITGFDTPVTSRGLFEAITSLESLEAVYETSIRSIILRNNKKLDEDFLVSINKSIKFLQAHDYEKFDRYTFIKEYFNPMMTLWVDIIEESGWKGKDRTPFNFYAPTFFEENSFNINFFMPPVNKNFSADQIELGEKLFFDKNLSKGGTMSCASCHIPEKAYADGMVKNLDNEGGLLERNTPTLLNSIYQKSFFWDGRSGNIMDQITAVFENPSEFNSGVHQLSDDILSDNSYAEMFKETYGNRSQGSKNVIRALSSYVSTLNSFNSKFDRNMRGEEDTFSSQEKLGFNIFMGKALCATCHFIPLTNGTVPPFYKETEREVLGIPATSENLALDKDYGIFWMNQMEFQRGMFKTPTIRNAEVTAPYMHNGVYKTLEEVIDFYDLGGGIGLGFDIPHQTLPSDKLDLSKMEKEALIAFIKTLTDSPIN